jgi:hypothetical protein
MRPLPKSFDFTLSSFLFSEQDTKIYPDFEVFLEENIRAEALKKEDDPLKRQVAGDLSSCQRIR